MTSGPLVIAAALILLGKIASCSASNFAYSNTFLCLSLHISPLWSLIYLPVCSLCLIRSTHLHATRHIHLWGPVLQSVRWGPWPLGEGEAWGVEPPAKICTCLIAYDLPWGSTGQCFRSCWITLVACTALVSIWRQHGDAWRSKTRRRRHWVRFGMGRDGVSPP